MEIFLWWHKDLGPSNKFIHFVINTKQSLYSTLQGAIREAQQIKYHRHWNSEISILEKWFDQDELLHLQVQG